MTLRKIEPLLAFIITFVIILFYYHELVFHPGKYLTSSEGDGIKNYAVFAGHIKNDVSYHQFQNMNYPYGQTHIFTDGQTGIANIFKWLSDYFKFFVDNSIALYNLMMVLSFPICALLLCVIIKRLYLPSLFSILGSVAITLLSPQLFRMFGHLTLSYVFYFPLIWWLYIKYIESNNKKYFWSFLIAFNSIFWFFIHPYYLMMSTIFLFFVWIIELLQTASKKKYLAGSILAALIQLLIPFVVTKLYIRAVDSHLFRSDSPWGFWNYYASWNTVFMPHHPPFNAIYQFFFPDKNQNWEGWAYVGLPAVFVVLFSLIKIIRYCIKKKFVLIIKPVLPPVLKTSLWASVLILFFSMCLPFQLGMHFLVDWLGFLKQFRSLGRFAWIFYYVFNVYALYVMFLAFRFLKMKKLNLAAYTLSTIYFSVYFIEASAYHKEGKESSVKSPNYFASEFLPNEYLNLISETNKIKSSYQCIIPFPFYNLGSENFGKEATSKCLQGSMVLSYWANMPLMASLAARSPIIEAKNIMQFFSPACFKKEIEKDMSSKKPFLILYSKEDLNTNEQYLLNQSEKIYSGSDFELWSLPYEKVFNYNASEWKNKFNEKKDSMNLINNFYEQSTDTFLYNSFDDKHSKFAYRGIGAVQGSKKDFTFLLPKGKYNLKNDRDYIVSFWYYNKDELRNQVSCVFEQCDAEGNNCKWETIWSPAESMTIDSDWSLVEKKIRVSDSNNQFSIFLNGDSKSTQEIFADELMIYAAGTNIYSIKNNELIKNNVACHLK